MTSIDGESSGRSMQGSALCLSGGGYRAMLFHVGVLWRLNEAALLQSLTCVSSVSGGSITSGVLATNWQRLEFDSAGVAGQLTEGLVRPVRRLAGKNLDGEAFFEGAVLPGTAADWATDRLRHEVYGERTLQDLPDAPEFVFNATNLATGVRFLMSKADMGDYKIGYILAPSLDLAAAVAASSAFPPVLSPLVLDLKEEPWTAPDEDLGAEFRRSVPLSDGGVYDNLGLQAGIRYETLLVSDAGGQLQPDTHPPAPPLHALGHMHRVLDVMKSQVRALRTQDLIDRFKSDPTSPRRRRGVYVGIRSEVAHYPARSPLPADPRVTARLASIPTRLAALSDQDQEMLINWGYAIADAGLTAHLGASPSADGLPYPDRPLTWT
jgi:NTE family protein